MRAIIAAALLPLAACGNSFTVDTDDKPGLPGSGSGNQRSYQAANFDMVELAGSDDVSVHIGSGFAVTAEGDVDALDTLKITREGSMLRVSRRNGRSRGHARVLVTMPAITGATLAGSGNLAIDRVDAGAFRARLAGSGNLTVAALHAETADLTVAGSGDAALSGVTGQLGVSIAGSGNVTLAGTSGRLDVSVAGSGDVAGERLVAKAADIKVMGAGDVRVTVDGQADVMAMGSGNVDLGARARCSVRKMGSGSVRCGG
ncbi:head GIN domain-containing protein [Sphingomonas sp. DT-51]|uniref:head GIN domain-containing protein n=1 Tax=Sphingomonas sp. DT-51 TaxID=3396165 RepID=UPI003F1C5289